MLVENADQEQRDKLDAQIMKEPTPGRGKAKSKVPVAFPLPLA